MFCNSCGENLDEGMRFCTRCGTAVTQEQPAQKVPQQQAQAMPTAAVPVKKPMGKKKITAIIIGIPVLVAIVVGSVALYTHIARLPLLQLSEGLNSYLADDYGSAIQTFNKVIADNKVDSEWMLVAYFYRADSYMKTGDSTRALSDAEEGLGYAAHHGLTNKSEAHDLTRLRDTINATSNTETSNFNVSAPDTASAPKQSQTQTKTQEPAKNTQAAQAAFNRGRTAYLQEENYDRAIVEFTEAIRLNPDYAEAYQNRALAYHQKNDYDKAITEYTQAIRMNPDYKDAYFNRGSAYREKGDYDRAIADYETYLRFEPDSFAASYFLDISRQARDE